MLTQYGVSEKKMALYFLHAVPVINSPLCQIYNKVTYIESGYFHETVPFT